MGNRHSRHLGSEHGEMELYIDWKDEGMLWWWTVNTVYCMHASVGKPPTNGPLIVGSTTPPKQEEGRMGYMYTIGGMT